MKTLSTLDSKYLLKSDYERIERELISLKDKFQPLQKELEFQILRAKNTMNHDRQFVQKEIDEINHHIIKNAKNQEKRDVQIDSLINGMKS